MRITKAGIEKAFKMIGVRLEDDDYFWDVLPDPVDDDVWDREDVEFHFRNLVTLVSNDDWLEDTVSALYVFIRRHHEDLGTRPTKKALFGFISRLDNGYMRFRPGKIFDEVVAAARKRYRNRDKFEAEKKARLQKSEAEAAARRQAWTPKKLKEQIAPVG
jgi:hypothetical protein